MQEAEPLAYTLGWVPFIHTKIYLDSHPLIPRTETEYWVDLAIKEIKDSGIIRPKVLDLCAGSGCIGVSILEEIPEALVDFAEIDVNHHQTITKNITENNLDISHTRIFGGDLFESINDKYDFILSNPPYINPELKNRVEPSVLEHEPWQALNGGKEGLEIVNRILNQAGNYLNKSGILYLEHEPEQTEKLSKSPFYSNTFTDQYGVGRYSKFSKFAKEETD